MRSTLGNLGLAVASLAVFFGFLEFFLFRVVLLPSDLPSLSAVPSSVLKYLPGQTGVYRVKNEIAAPFSINLNGWNSAVKEYQEQSSGEGKRICVVGDSYVESLQVRPGANFAEIAARKLQEDYQSVFRFGISGAPLSHYLYMIEHEVLRFGPDILVVNLVHNDFRESWVPGGGTYDHSLARFQIDDNEEVRLGGPEQYRRDWTWWLKQSATFRYLWVRWKIRPQNLKSLFLRFQKNSDQDQEFSANIRVSDALDPRIENGVEYAFSKLRELEKAEALKVILILDSNSRGTRPRQYEQVSEGEKSPVVKMEEMVLRIAQEYNLEIIDLADVFFQSFQRDGIPFSFVHDGHWNSYAHRVVGQALVRVIGKFQ